jgi:DNA modification methylase
MDKINWHLESRKIKDLKPFVKNPRKLSDLDGQQLQKSIEKFGLIDKPIITTDNRIIGGHQRISILKKMGEKEVECYVPDRELSEKDIEELCIRLNRNIGEWDFDILANEWDTQELIDWGFTPEELAIDSATLLDPVEEDSEILDPGKDEDAITKQGDRLVLGDHVLVCGDSTLPDVVQNCLKDAIPILMVTDPPYGVEYDPTWRKDIHNKKGTACRAAGKVQNDDKINWALAWSLFPGSVAYIWHAGKYCSEVQKSLEEAEFEIIGQIIWAKQHFVLSRGDYHWQHEPCWYAVKKGHNHNWQGARDQSTVWELANLNAFGTNKDDERTAHSTQKPLECMSRPIRNNSAEGDLVYDPFLGSGTTLIAAEQYKRKCYGIELSPAYCDIIVKRWIAFRKKAGKDCPITKNGEKTEEYYG